MKKIVYIILTLLAVIGLSSVGFSQHTITVPSVETVAVTGTVNTKAIGTTTVTGTITSNPSGTQSITGSVTVSNPTNVISSGTLNAGGFTNKIVNAITTSTPAYSTGDNIGGIITISNGARVAGSTAVLNDLVIWSTETQTPALTVDLWMASPTGTFTDNGAQTINDVTNWIGSVSVNSADYEVTGTIARASITGVALTLIANGSSKNIFATIKVASATGAPQWTGSTTGITFKWGLLQD